MRHTWLLIFALLAVFGCGDGDRVTDSGTPPPAITHDYVTIVADSGWRMFNGYAALFVGTWSYDIDTLPDTLHVRPEGQEYRLSVPVYNDSNMAPQSIDTTVTSSSHRDREGITIWTFVSEGTLDRCTLWVF